MTSDDKPDAQREIKVSPTTAVEGPTNDASPMIQAALGELRATGGCVVIEEGEYQVIAGVTVPSGVSVRLNRATIRVRGDKPVLKSLPGSENVSVSGVVSVSAGGSASNAFSFFGTRGVVVNLDAEVSGARAGRGLISCDQCTSVLVQGTFRSQDSRIFIAADTSDLDVSGIRAGPYTVDPQDGIVKVVAKGARGPVSNIRLHDLSIHGGGVLARTGAVDVEAVPGQPDITGVSIHDVTVSDTLRLVDGVDVNRCSDVEIRNVIGARVNALVSVIGSRARVENVSAQDCRAQSFAYGDPTYQTTNIQECTAQMIRATNCGAGYGGVAGSGVAAFQSPGTTTAELELRDVISIDTTGQSQPFGLGIGAGVVHVRVVGGQLRGYKGAVKDLSPPGNVQYQGVAGAP